MTDASSTEQVSETSAAEESFFAELLTEDAGVWDLFDEPPQLTPPPRMERQLTFTDPRSLLAIPGVRTASCHGLEPVNGSSVEGFCIEDICTAVDDFSATFSWACETNFGSLDRSVSFPSVPASAWLGAERDFSVARI